MIAHWRVDYIGKGGKHLGNVEALDERRAIGEKRDKLEKT
jgi:hypothetical protein